jgi:hypothetical protein
MIERNIQIDEEEKECRESDFSTVHPIESHAPTSDITTNNSVCQRDIWIHNVISQWYTPQSFSTEQQTLAPRITMSLVREDLDMKHYTLGRLP